ncbi:hypothetical protein [Shewanella psychrotolerans]|uniref:hypothetical protein n=1 Tax=Shewanella psychrotolerans TaxID=2864206 RepID=UPI001C656471|nr:hypothetical protein [Shewanella psychrotolerans]QYK03126.1 hypothetical protein K0I62_09500 [Shewanella psychrotolerans]
MINVIMSAEPVDLTPKFDQLKADILADNAAKLTANLTASENQNAVIDNKIDNLTTVNSATNTKIDEVKSDIASKVVIKSIQRGESLVSYESVINIAISAVDLNKSILNINCADGVSKTASGTTSDSTSFSAGGILTSATNLKLVGAKKLNAYMSYASIVFWEVIEYE